MDMGSGVDVRGRPATAATPDIIDIVR